jgi:hypothetical protein
VRQPLEGRGLESHRGLVFHAALEEKVKRLAKVFACAWILQTEAQSPQPLGRTGTSELSEIWSCCSVDAQQWNTE